MMSLSPGDIVTKLKFLFIVVISLFGVSACPRRAGPLRPCRVLTPAFAQ